jgi:hypothetical protein
MKRISDFYGITGSLPFVDVDLDDDNRLYLDPHAIRLAIGPMPFAKDAVACADGFFREVTACIIVGDLASLARGEALLQRFFEPWETRLGMAVKGFRGHGGADLIGSMIWTALIQDVEALVRVGILRQIEDLPLFVKGVDRDITSDITTRLMFGPLADFTAKMIATYPEFANTGDGVREFKKQVWDPTENAWAEATVTLPVVDGKPLLLVPAGWARPTLLMSAKRFYETAVLTFAQAEQAVPLEDGTFLTTPKDSLREQSGLERGRQTNIRVTQRAFANEQDLLAFFKAFVDGRYDPPADAVGAAA